VTNRDETHPDSAGPGRWVCGLVEPDHSTWGSLLSDSRGYAFKFPCELVSKFAPPGLVLFCTGVLYERQVQRMQRKVSRATWNALKLSQILLVRLIDRPISLSICHYPTCMHSVMFVADNHDIDFHGACMMPYGIPKKIMWISRVHENYMIVQHKYFARHRRDAVFENLIVGRPIVRFSKPTAESFSPWNTIMFIALHDVEEKLLNLFKIWWKYCLVCRKLHEQCIGPALLTKQVMVEHWQRSLCPRNLTRMNSINDTN
jgi:hypothetical protein